MKGPIRSSSQTIHDRDPKSLLGHRLGHNEVDIALIKPTKSPVEIRSRFPKINGWAKNFYSNIFLMFFLKSSSERQETDLCTMRNLIHVRIQDVKPLFGGVMTGETSRCIHNALSDEHMSKLS